MTKSEALFSDFQNAHARFIEILNEKPSDIVRDSAIKRFELVFDLSWKLIKASLEEHGVFCASPLTCFKDGYRQGMLADEKMWITMVELRNKTVHTYDLALAEDVWRALPELLPAFERLARMLTNQSPISS